MSYFLLYLWTVIWYCWNNNPPGLRPLLLILMYHPFASAQLKVVGRGCPGGDHESHSCCLHLQHP